MERVQAKDPVQGGWSVDSTMDCMVWCDASSLAIGCCAEINGVVIEDAAWLRKEDDVSHINVAELEAAIKGISLALKWGLSDFELVTDSASVYSWIQSILEDTKRPKVQGISEMIVKRRLGIVKQLIEDYEIRLSLSLVPSEKNVADKLTRVPQKWLKQSVCTATITSKAEEVSVVRELHERHHLGMTRTASVVKRIYPDIDQKLVAQVVKSCQMCRQIDPAPVTWEHGHLEVDLNWKRLAVDVAYVSRKPYLTLIDCGPSRFTLWIPMLNETAGHVIKLLLRVFLERGPPEELLCDYGPCFRSRETKTFLDYWGVKIVFCCAYRHSGNGIIERNHRTIKRMVARSGRGVEEMVYWYNNTPNYAKVVPAVALYSYHARLPGEPTRMARKPSINMNPYRVGDQVYVRPGQARCDSKWEGAAVTGIVSENVVEVDGINRHIADVRLGVEQIGTAQDSTKQWFYNPRPPAEVEVEFGRVHEDDDDDISSSDDGQVTSSDDDNGSDNSVQSHEELPRDRRPPRWLADFYLD